MKKRICAIFLISTLAMGVLAGCGDATGVDNDANDTQTVSASEGAESNGEFDLDEAFAKETGNGDPIRIVSTFEGTCQVQTQIAYLLGFYEQEGLTEGVDYEFIDAGGETGAVLISTDKADVAIGLISGMLQPLDNGLEAKAISGLHTGCITIVTKAELIQLLTLKERQLV